tara:strand:+ start:130155 stop:130913 length:759 start_codon:yes stop_codon:yes gene_type:complete
METWLPLTDYSSKYKISVSTLRRRIKADDIKYHFQDGKYFIFDEPIKNTIKSGPSLNSLDGMSSDLIFDDEILNDLDTASEPIETEKMYSNRQQPVVTPMSQQAYNPDFLENLKKSANAKLPQVKMQQGIISQQQQQQQTLRPQAAINIDEEYFFRRERQPAAPAPIEKVETHTAEFENPTLREFSDKISKIGTNEPVLTAANKLLNELKKAYTQILQEKEEQMMILKEEVSDLKTLVKVLESENDRLKKNW